MARPIRADLQVRSFATTREGRPVPGLDSWLPTHIDRTRPAGACTQDGVVESRASDVYACRG